MNNETKRPLKVFLCHAHSDRYAVRALYKRLTQDGVDAWLDKEKLLPGQDWAAEIRKAVEKSDVVIVCLSKNFNQEGFRQKEVRIALETADMKPENTIFIIPVRLEECDSLDTLRRWQWVDLFEKDGYRLLKRALNARAQQIGAILSQKKGSTKPVSSNASSDSVELYKNLDTPSSKQGTKSNLPLKQIANPQSKLNEVYKSETNKPSRKHNVQVIVAIVGALATICAAVLGNLPWKEWFVPNPTVAYTRTSTHDLGLPTVLDTSTPTRLLETLTPPEITLTATPLPTEITDSKGLSMRLIPAGTFTMGRDNGRANEKPAHEVYLDSYYMDTYEVTNAFYKACVAAGVCDRPRLTTSYNRYFYYNSSEFDNFPVIHVDWVMAKTYCEWRGASLPTEAQWEKGARGTDARTYPWGEGLEPTLANYANYLQSINDTTEVGSYPGGISPYGLFDMAGNVWEWVADWYGQTYYSSSPLSNPLGPLSGEYRVLRGGSWIEYNPSTTIRDINYPTWRGSVTTDVGFRCALRVP